MELRAREERREARRDTIILPMLSAGGIGKKELEGQLPLEQLDRYYWWDFTRRELRITS